MSAPTAELVLRRIQDSGGRVTVPTRLVVSVLAQTDQHLTADDLIAHLERRAPGIAPSTVYRVLQRLDELGLLEHVHSGAGAAFYHLHQHGHAHLVCTECGSVTDLSGEAADALRRFSAAVRATHRFSVDPHHAAMLGRCESCSTSRSHQHRHVSEAEVSVTDPPTGDGLMEVRHTRTAPLP